MMPGLNAGFWASLVAVGRKEFVHISRDRAAIVAMLIMPILELGLFASVDFRVDHVPTVVVEQSRSHHSRELLEKLTATGTFAVTAFAPTTAAARAMIAAGDASVGIVVPVDYHELRAREHPSPVFVLVDGSNVSISNAVLATLRGLSSSLNTDAARGAVIDVRPQVLYNPAGKTAVFLLPGIVAILLQIAGVVQTTATIVRERERGTLEQLLLTPIDPLGMLLGKITPYLVLSVLEAVLIVGIMCGLFDVPFHGSPMALAVSVLMYLLALLAMGTFVSSISTTQHEANEIAQALFIPAFFLSGFMFPTSNMPALLVWVGLAFPVTHMIEIMRGIVVRGATLYELWPHVVTLGVMAVSFWWLAARRVQAFMWR